MAINEKMYRELYSLRQRIKENEKRKEGRAPLVCTDDSLYEIAQLCPKKLSDFNGVSGIGKTFIENYGNQFLSVILKYSEAPTEKMISINESAANTLKELEKKLVSINRRNRLLYMPKIANKYAYDLHSLGQSNLEQIIFDNKPMIICDLSKDLVQNRRFEVTEESKYKKIVQLLREVNKDLRDKGQNDLYIGYPYVIGRLPGENFDVRAPLALFPVVAERTATSILISIDDSRDVVYNTTLILAHYKFNNISKQLPAEEIESYSRSSFIEDILRFYKESEIEIQDNLTGLSKFVDYKADEFPEYRSGELFLERCAVLGKYPLCSSSIQKDFGEILNANEINVLLNDLLVNAEDVDYYSDNYAGIDGINYKDKKT